MSSQIEIVRNIVSRVADQREMPDDWWEEPLDAALNLIEQRMKELERETIRLAHEIERLESDKHYRDREITRLNEANLQK